MDWTLLEHLICTKQFDNQIEKTNKVLFSLIKKV